MASPHDLTATLVLFSTILFLSGVLPPPLPLLRVQAQQPYGTQIADCSNPHNSSGLLGYFCGGIADGNTSITSPPSCPTFLTFNARAPRSTAASIAALLNADPATILAPPPPPNATTFPELPDGTRVLVPATCACTATPSGGASFYQRNSTYVAAAGDTLLIIANETFQGLTTCQALESQALRGAPPQSLDAGQALLPVPLRCACPTAAQAAAGARYLVTYLVDVGDELAAVAARFGVDVSAVADANQLLPPFTIFPYTSLLIPVAAQPDVSRIQTPPPPPPPVLTPPAPGTKSGNHVDAYIGVAVAVVAVVTIVSAGAFLALRARRRRAGAVLATAGGEAVAVEKKGKAGKESNDRAAAAATSSGFGVTGTGGGEFSASISSALSSIISVTDIKSSLKVYTYAELKAATDDFSPGRRIGGSSVYRAEFNGDAAAVEVVDWDVSTEVELMRRINHLNLIRLVGLSHHRGRWYLVTEFADHGSLRDRLQLAAGESAARAPALTWAQRVQVALDVAEGLRYLHEYARPAWVHMDVSSGSVLLAGDGPRAKLRGFSAARAITGATTGAGDGEAMFTMTSRIAGTRGYMAPEYVEHGVVSPKADVYSLGVVMLELVTGRDAEDLVGGGDGGLGDRDPFAALRELAEELDGGGERLEELLDPALPAGSCPQDAVGMVVRLIERCVRQDPARRPTTGEVAQQLLKLSGVSVLGWRRNSPAESPRSSGSSGSGKGLMY